MPFGIPLAVMETEPVNPFCALIVIVTGEVVPLTCVDTDAGATLIVKSPTGCVETGEEEPPQDARQNEATAVKSSIVRLTSSSK